MEVLIPFALQVSSGKLVTPDEVENGENCGCKCPACDAPMVAKQGSVKVWHFAHKPKSVSADKPCSFNFRRGCFWLARQLITDSLKEPLKLPDYHISLNDPAGLNSKLELVTAASAPVFEQVHFQPMPQHMSSDNVELTLHGHKLMLILGFNIQHSKSSYKDATVFVDLTGAEQEYRQHKRSLKAILLDRIFQQTSAKRWLYHPNEKKKKDQFAIYLKAADAERARRAQERFTFQPSYAVAKVQPKSEAHQQAKEQLQTKTQLLTKEQISHSVDIEERLLDLIGQAARLFTFGHKAVLQCDNCYYLTPPDSTSCQYCQSSKFCKIGLSDEYFKDIKGKYLRVGYAQHSLKALPKINGTH
jgi:hypothetical protein